MKIIKETSEQDIIKALLEEHIEEYLDNEREYLDRTLEHNIILWARALKMCKNDQKMASAIHRTLNNWKDGAPLSLQDAEYALTEDDEPICGICGKGLWEKKQ